MLDDETTSTNLGEVTGATKIDRRLLHDAPCVEAFIDDVHRNVRVFAPLLPGPRISM